MFHLMPAKRNVNLKHSSSQLQFVNEDVYQQHLSQDDKCFCSRSMCKPLQVYTEADEDCLQRNNFLVNFVLHSIVDFLF